MAFAATKVWWGQTHSLEFKMNSPIILYRHCCQETSGKSEPTDEWWPSDKYCWFPVSISMSSGTCEGADTQDTQCSMCETQKKTEKWKHAVQLRLCINIRCAHFQNILRPQPTDTQHTAARNAWRRTNAARGSTKEDSGNKSARLKKVGEKKERPENSHFPLWAASMH